jgi:hypothetical protein
MTVDGTVSSQYPGSLVMTCPGRRDTGVENECGPSCTLRYAPTPCPVPCYKPKTSTDWGREKKRAITTHHVIEAVFPQRPPSQNIELLARGAFREHSGINRNLQTNKKQVIRTVNQRSNSITTHMTLQDPRVRFALLRRRSSKVDGPRRIACAVQVLSTGITAKESAPTQQCTHESIWRTAHKASLDRSCDNCVWSVCNVAELETKD